MQQPEGSVLLRDVRETVASVAGGNDGDLRIVVLA
jgi:hypothetical protein